MIDIDETMSREVGLTALKTWIILLGYQARYRVSEIRRCYLPTED